MTLVNTGKILAEQPFVVAANAILLEQAEAILVASEAAETGLVLQLSENTIRYHGSIGPIGSALLAIAREAGTDISVHLDHATSPDLVLKAIDMGFSSVMFDGSQLEYEENLATTTRLAKASRDSGVWFEAELGEVGGKDGVHAPGVRTDPDQARHFVETTKVDGLAVAVGSSHAMAQKGSTLDFSLIEKLTDVVPVPLVLHGSSGVELGDLRTAIKAGIRKVNVATEFNIIFNNAIRDYFLTSSSLSDPRKYLKPARVAMSEALESYLHALQV